MTALDLTVSVGIPTYNRATTLERAIRSLMGQTYTNLEIVISDDASSDATESLCREIAQQDDRIRYIRQPQNIGPTANYNLIFATLQTTYVMVLADDDWVEPNYVERCLEALLQETECIAVSGLGRYWRGDELLARQGLDVQLAQKRGVDRLLAYCRVVGGGRGENSTFFGVMQSDVLHRATPMPNVLGNDMLATAGMVFQGGVRTLSDVRLNRSVGGTSVSVASIVSTLGLPPRQSSFPSFVIAGQFLCDIGWRNPLYGSMAPASRLWWGARCAVAAIDWQSVGWHATAPVAAWLGSRRRGRWISSAYDRLVRALMARRFKEVRP
jgi:hypothetical protein